MGILQKAFNYFKSEEAEEEAVREAAGATVDSDDDEWRRLTGDSSRDISPMTAKRARDLSVHLWRTNTLANRLIELPVAYLLAEGVELVVADEEVQGWLNAFWSDPINNMDMKLPKKVRELSLYGEQCWPAFVNEHNGHVRLGYLDPDNIGTVVTDPDNIEQVIGIVTKPDKKGNKRRYKVIVNGGEHMFTKSTQAIRETFTDGQCFYFRINELSNSTRGSGDLLAQIDWLDAYDHFLFGEIDRADFMRAFVWDVEMKGLTEEEIKNKLKNMTAPSPGSVRGHNESETWNAISPQLGAGDTESLSRLFRNHVIGGSTMPEHWFGGGGDVNRATGESMSEPTFKVYTMRQKIIGYMLEQVALFQINCRLDPSGKTMLDPADYDADFTPKAIFPEMTAKDTTKYASALQQVVVAAGIAVDKNFLSELMAVKIIQSVGERLGVDINPEEELKTALEEKQGRDEDDVFTAVEDDEVSGDE